jgi:hypothetical protein
MELMIIGFIIVWIGLGYAVAEMGKTRRIGHSSALWISILFSPLLGLLIVLISPEVEGSIAQRSSGGSGGGNGDRFKVSLDDAKKAEFKGEIEKAISLYQDTLYYLDNDYKNLNDKVEKNRQATIADVRGRIERLKSKGE